MNRFSNPKKRNIAISNTMKGRKLSTLHKTRISLSMKGNKQNLNTLKNADNPKLERDV